FFSSRRRHTRSKRDWSSDVCSSDLVRGQRGWVVERIGDQATLEKLEEGEEDPALPLLMQNFLIQFYGDAVEREKLEAEEDAALQRRGVDQESRATPRRVQVVPREILVH